MWNLLLLFFMGVITVRSTATSLHTPCKLDDNACLVDQSNIFYKEYVKGDPSKNIESSDPMFQDEIVGNIPSLKTYRLSNATLEGFKKCDITAAFLSIEKYLMTYTLDCPLFLFYGKYEVDGQLLDIPIQGNGDFKIEFKNYHITVETDLKVTENSGTKYLSFVDFRVSSKLLGGLKANLTNLFNGEKDLANRALKYIHENWRAVADFAQQPVIYANVKKLVISFNKILKTIPLDTLVISD